MKDETAEYKGKVYQIGKYYLFSYEEGEDTCYGELSCIYPFRHYPFITNCGGAFKCIIESKKSNGTIKPAPMKLIDGNAYMFDYKCETLCGIYDEDGKLMHMKTGWVNTCYVENIRRMPVEPEQ